MAFHFERKREREILGVYFILGGVKWGRAYGGKERDYRKEGMGMLKLEWEKEG